jgi:hypothetical protein
LSQARARESHSRWSLEGMPAMNEYGLREENSQLYILEPIASVLPTRIAIRSVEPCRSDYSYQFAGLVSDKGAYLCNDCYPELRNLCRSYVGCRSAGLGRAGLVAVRVSRSSDADSADSADSADGRRGGEACPDPRPISKWLCAMLWKPKRVFRSRKS